MTSIFQPVLDMMGDPMFTNTELVNAATVIYAEHRLMFSSSWVTDDPGWKELSGNIRYNCIVHWVKHYGHPP